MFPAPDEPTGSPETTGIASSPSPQSADRSLAGAATDRSVWNLRFLLVLVIVAVYAAAIYLPFLGSGRALTSHEVMVTQPAMRLLADGQWIVPKYTSTYWLDKPPLANWVTAGFLALAGGFSEFVVRLPAALSAIGIALLVTLATRRFYDNLTALFAGLVQATCVYGYMQGRLGEIDMPFAFLMTAAQIVLLWNWGGGRTDLPLGAAALFHTLAALAVLAKGPIAVVLFGLTVLGFCWLRGSWRPLRATLWTPAILIFLAITVWWHVAAIQIAGDMAWRQWVYNYFIRFGGGIHLAPGQLLLYFYTIPWLMLPWTILLVIGGRELWREFRRPEAYVDRYLWSWFLTGLIFLTISAHKHKHYCLPILPPLAIMSARLVIWHLALDPKRAKQFYVGVFAVALIAYGVISGVVMPRRDHRRPQVEFVQTSLSQMPADTKLYVFGLGQSAIYPYLNRPVTYVSAGEEKVDIALLLNKDRDNILKKQLIENVRLVLDDPANRPMWVLTLKEHLPLAAANGLAFDEIAVGPVGRKSSADIDDDKDGKKKPDETLVFVRPR